MPDVRAAPIRTEHTDRIGTPLSLGGHQDSEVENELLSASIRAVATETTPIRLPGTKRVPERWFRSRLGYPATTTTMGFCPPVPDSCSVSECGNSTATVEVRALDVAPADRTSTKLVETRLSAISGPRLDGNFKGVDGCGCPGAVVSGPDRRRRDSTGSSRALPWRRRRCCRWTFALPGSRAS